MMLRSRLQSFLGLTIILILLFGCASLDTVEDNFYLGMTKSDFCRSTLSITISEDPCVGEDFIFSPRILIITNKIKSRYFVFDSDELVGSTLSYEKALQKAKNIPDLRGNNQTKTNKSEISDRTKTHLKKNISSNTLLIGPEVSNIWDCGYADRYTKSSKCHFKNASKERFSWTGEVSPVNFDEAIPNGWGLVDQSDVDGGGSFKLLIEYGEVASGVFTYANGDVYMGETDKNLNMLNGIFENEDVYFSGSFRNNFFYEGDLLLKKHDIKFSGVLRSNVKIGFVKGDMDYKKCGSEVSFSGFFKDGNVMDFERDFLIRFPEVTVYKSDTKGESFISSFAAQDKVFTDDIMIEDGYLLAKSITIKNKDNSVDVVDFYGPSVKSCDLKNEFIVKERILNPSFKRFHIGAFKGSYLSYLQSLGFMSPPEKYEMDYGQFVSLEVVDRKNTREVIDRFEVRSKYISSQREVLNPDYDIFKSQLDLATMKLYEARSKKENAPSCVDAKNIFKCELAKGFVYSTSSAEKEYEDAIRNLQRTPRTLLKNVYSDYKVEKLKIHTKKTATLRFLYVDVKSDKVFIDDKPISESSNFILINSPVMNSDKNKRKILRGTSSENDVDNWIRDDIDIGNTNHPQLSSFISSKKGRSYTEWATLAGVKFSNDTDVEGKSGLNKADYSLKDSILVVSNINGHGTGFYVTENHVVTNEHVVGDSGFVDLKNYDQVTFLGEVIDTDIGTDLALIMVENAGVPLKLEANCNVSDSEEVFTIGHPRGLEFSLSKGIVSAVRKMPNPFYAIVGDKQYIQTDAAISPGNSGGPLFNKSKHVVGVNTWARNDGQGLNFSIHCSELKRYLSKNKLH